MSEYKRPSYIYLACCGSFIWLSLCHSRCRPAWCQAAVSGAWEVCGVSVRCGHLSVVDSLMVRMCIVLEHQTFWADSGE